MIQKTLDYCKSNDLGPGAKLRAFFTDSRLRDSFEIVALNCLFFPYALRQFFREIDIVQSEIVNCAPECQRESDVFSTSEVSKKNLGVKVNPFNPY